MDVCVNKIFGLVWVQCNKSLQALVKLDAGFESKSASFDGFWLLKECQKRIIGCNERKNQALLLWEKQI